MVKVLILFYSTYTHIFKLAEAIAEGASSVENAQVVVKRVPETLPTEVLAKMGALDAQKAMEHIPIASIDELPQYDAIIFGTPTRFGTMAAQMKTFIDATGQIWTKGELVGKVGSCFTSSATQHGGQEITLLNSMITLLHHGMFYVGVPFIPELMTIDQIEGGSCYGSGTIAGGAGERMLSAAEKEIAKAHGKHVTSIAKKIVEYSSLKMETKSEQVVLSQNTTEQPAKTTSNSNTVSTSTAAVVSSSPSTVETSKQVSVQQEKTNVQQQEQQQPPVRKEQTKESSCCLIL